MRRRYGFLVSLCTTETPSGAMPGVGGVPGALREPDQGPA
jgi:hypothetical protein